MAGANGSKEIEALKTEFGDDCKMIGNHTIRILINYADIVLELEVCPQYPAEVPRIVIESDDLKADVRENLELYLKSEAKDSVGSPMLQHLVQKAKEWCQGNNIQAMVAEADGQSKPKVKLLIPQQPKKSRMQRFKEGVSAFFWDGINY